MAGWSDLPLDILILIAQHVSFIEDFASFSTISKDCRRIGAMLKNKISLPPRYPRLMLAENKHEPSLRGFFNISTSTTIEVELPEAAGRFCYGAHYGWLFTLGFDLQINLLHPFSRQQIALPPMLTLPHQYEYDEKFPPQSVVHMFVQKLAISESPLKGNKLNKECVIVVIYGESSTLAFARIGDAIWTNIHDSFRNCTDIACHKGKFYVVFWDSQVVVFDVDDNYVLKATVVVSAPCQTYGESRKYLVESTGNLLVVIRNPVLLDDEIEYLFDDDGDEYCIFHRTDKKPHYHTIEFSIWRLDERPKKDNNLTYQWTSVTNLGDRALFLGRNVSTSKASSYDIKTNCIYFTDDYFELHFTEPEGGGWDTGFVNLEDGNITFEYTQESLSKISPSLWYI